MTAGLPDAVRLDLEELARRRRRFVVPLLLGALSSYALVLLAFAYWPGLVRREVVGAFNVAYLLAVSQFVMTFVVGLVYSSWARRVSDPLAARIRGELERGDTERALAELARRPANPHPARRAVTQEA